MSSKVSVEKSAERVRKPINPVALISPDKKELKAVKPAKPCPGSNINIALLLKVKQAILDEPYRFNMDFWINPIENNYLIDVSTGARQTVPEKEQKEASCGTAACIAGHAILASGYNYKCGSDILEDFANPIAAGMEILGLDKRQARRLFATSGWPGQFRVPYAYANNFKEKSKIAAARIDHFIATCGKE